MAELIPSTNNVTSYIRPFSLLCWIFWKFHALCVEADVSEPTSNDLRAFRERIEVLFTWGARLTDYPGIPGKQADPPVSESEFLPLTFKDWSRVQSSTSLIAALWYGPASKAVTGLGFLMPLPRKPGFFRIVERGVALAEALDHLLQADSARYRRLLATLAPVAASEDDARALWGSCGVLRRRAPPKRKRSGQRSSRRLPSVITAVSLASAAAPSPLRGFISRSARRR